MQGAGFLQAAKCMQSAEGAEGGAEALCEDCADGEDDDGRGGSGAGETGGSGTGGAGADSGATAHRRRTNATLVFSERARELLEDRVGEWHWRPRFGDG